MRDTVSVGVVPAGRLVFLNGGTPALVVVNLDGTNRRTIDAAGPGLIYSDGMAWLPDGSGFIYSLGSYGGQRLYVHIVASGTATRLIAAPPAGLNEEVHPVFSPNGQTIYFSGRNGTNGTFSLWSMPANGSAAPTRLLSANGTLNSYISASPSPDGTRLAFVDYSTIEVLTLSTGAIAVVAAGESVHWSPSGNRIAYGLGTQEWYAAADGSNPQAASLDDGLAGSVVTWSPDGYWLMYGTNPYLEIYQVTTGVRVTLRPLGVNKFAPHWAPN